jgi:hypothetical protein
MTLMCAVVRGLGDGIHRGLSIHMNRSAYDNESFVFVASFSVLLPSIAIGTWLFSIFENSNPNLYLVE